MNLDSLYAALRTPDFLAQGACVRQDATLWDDDDRAKSAVAKAICGTCPVQRSCAEWAQANEIAGIWGGIDTATRNKGRRGKFTTMEQRRENAEWLSDVLSKKPAIELAAKYGRTERTIYRWREIAQRDDYGLAS